MEQEIQSQSPAMGQPPSQFEPPQQNNPRSHLIVYIISALVVIGLIAGGIYYFMTSAKPKNNDVSNQTSQNTPVKKAYTNTTFKYAVNYENNWRVAENYSKHLSVLKQTDFQLNAAGCSLKSAEGIDIDPNEDLKQYTQCAKDKANLVQPKLDDFQLNWKIENSDYIVFTDRTPSEEQQWIQNQANGIMAVDTEKGHVIEIYPVQEALSLEKETPPDSKSKIRIKIITLDSGIKATQIDARALPAGPNLLVSFPNSAYWAKGLAFKTTAQSGSNEETEFFNLVNSVQITQ